MATRFLHGRKAHREHFSVRKTRDYGVECSSLPLFPLQTCSSLFYYKPAHGFSFLFLLPSKRQKKKWKCWWKIRLVHPMSVNPQLFPSFPHQASLLWRHPSSHIKSREILMNNFSVWVMGKFFVRNFPSFFDLLLRSIYANTIHLFCSFYDFIFMWLQGLNRENRLRWFSNKGEKVCKIFPYFYKQFSDFFMKEMQIVERKILRVVDAQLWFFIVCRTFESCNDVLNFCQFFLFVFRILRKEETVTKLMRALFAVPSFLRSFSCLRPLI